MNKYIIFLVPESDIITLNGDTSVKIKMETGDTKWKLLIKTFAEIV